MRSEYITERFGWTGWSTLARTDGRIWLPLVRTYRAIGYGWRAVAEPDGQTGSLVRESLIDTLHYAFFA